MIAKSTWCSNTRLNPCGGRRRRSPSIAMTTWYTCPGRVPTPLWLARW
jgi:hypothetical protein